MKRRISVTAGVFATGLVLLLAAERAFERTAGERILDLYLEPGSNPFRLVDTQTGSQWDFSGKAVQGPLAGTQLPRIQTLKDYWFDWKLYNPQTLVYQAGKMARQ